MRGSPWRGGALMMALGALCVGLLILIIGIRALLRLGGTVDPAPHDRAEGEDADGELMAKRVLYRRGFWRL